MKKFVAIMLIAMGAVAFAQTAAVRESSLSPAQLNIANAQRLIDKNPKDFEASRPSRT